jgi:hypothetical protein
MARRPPVRQVHVVVVAHDPTVLRLTLLGICHQDRPADSVVICCDNDRSEFLPTCQSLADEWASELDLLIRPFAGEPRPAQVRNNGIRHLLAQGANDDDLVVFFDGDSCPRLNALSQHEQYGQRADLVIGQRYRMSASETEAFDEKAFLEGAPPIPLDPKQLAWIDRRHRRGVRQRWLQRVGLNKPHKPKLLGANHAVRIATLRAINGFDERFMGWGSEDDDLSRRAYRSGATPAIAIN